MASVFDRQRFVDQLEQRESGGRSDITNEWGYTGKGQFGEQRLQDLGLGRDFTMEDFRTNRPFGGGDKRTQDVVMQRHLNDIDSFIANNGLDQYEGQTIGGRPVDRAAMYSIAHLGGNQGLKRYLTSGGEYNPSDQLGTSLSDYHDTFQGSGRVGPTRDNAASAEDRFNTEMQGYSDFIQDRKTGTDRWFDMASEFSATNARMEQMMMKNLFGVDEDELKPLSQKRMEEMQAMSQPPEVQALQQMRKGQIPQHPMQGAQGQYPPQQTPPPQGSAHPMQGAQGQYPPQQTPQQPQQPAIPPAPTSPSQVQPTPASVSTQGPRLNIPAQTVADDTAQSPNRDMDAEKQKRRAMLGRLLTGFGVGIGQISKGQAPNIMPAMESLHNMAMDRERSTGDPQSGQRLAHAAQLIQQGAPLPQAAMAAGLTEAEDLSRLHTITKPPAGSSGEPPIDPASFGDTLSALPPEIGSMVTKMLPMGGEATKQALQMIDSAGINTQRQDHRREGWEVGLNNDQILEEQQFRNRLEENLQEAGIRANEVDVERAYKEEQGQHLNQALRPSASQEDVQQALSSMTPSTRKLYNDAMQDSSMMAQARQIVEDGLAPTVGDALFSIRKSGATNIDLGSKADQWEIQDRIDARDKLADDLKIRGDAARESLPLLADLEQVNDAMLEEDQESSVFSGIIRTGVQAVADLGGTALKRRVADELGVDVERLSGVSENAQRLAFAIARANKGQGSITQQERDAMLQQVPNLLKSSRGRQILINQMQSFSELDRLAEQLFIDQAFSAGALQGKQHPRQIANKVANDLTSVAKSLNVSMRQQGNMAELLDAADQALMSGGTMTPKQEEVLSYQAILDGSVPDATEEQIQEAVDFIYGKSAPKLTEEQASIIPAHLLPSGYYMTPDNKLRTR